MANLTPSAKSGDTWTPYELRAFKIKVVREDNQAFFGAADLPAPNGVSPIIWNNVTAPPGPIPKIFRDFFAFLEDMMWRRQGEESLVIEFAAILFEMLGYDAGQRILQRRREVLFDMCGIEVDAKVDVTVVDEWHSPSFFRYILLFKEDKSYDSGDEYPESQLIATALAAFHKINKMRLKAGMPALESQTFPGITMVGSAPTFYKITITSELALAVAGGVYPENETIVRKFVPPVPEPLNYAAQGMVPLENRRIVLQCFEAFRQFVV
ncbi:hypothetical protein DFP72DRAFT_1169858 [Ephemerocybe angulata]|uniref:Uncharacterized protein n=1 Tax=Ephemerocybe angulata TaxID=980116 RepID=A0A8H6M4Y5_9AGAR|nr:hypothetical protein DFP72DRAFT_1169858 [Tulosesus angulatus]